MESSFKMSKGYIRDAYRTDQAYNLKTDSHGHYIEPILI